MEPPNSEAGYLEIPLSGDDNGGSLGPLCPVCNSSRVIQRTRQNAGQDGSNAAALMFLHP